MRRPVPTAHAAIVFAALSAVALAACGYAPKFENGTLHCSQDTCPKGYMCVADKTCWSNGSLPGQDLTANDFVGHWLFASGSTSTITCSDAPTKPVTKPLVDYVDFTRGGVTELAGSYYCDWNLTLDVPPSETTIAPGQSCMTTNADGSRFTWHGQKFQFRTSDGTNGQLQAEIGSEFVDKNNATGTCLVKISGTLTNAGPP